MRRGLEWALYGIVRFVDMNECDFAVLLSICHSVLLVCLLDVTKLTCSMQHALRWTKVAVSAINSMPAPGRTRLFCCCITTYNKTHTRIKFDMLG